LVDAFICYKQKRSGPVFWPTLYITGIYNTCNTQFMYMLYLCCLVLDKQVDVIIIWY